MRGKEKGKRKENEFVWSIMLWLSANSISAEQHDPFSYILVIPIPSLLMFSPL
jgi:hypothetical protein